MSSQTGSDYCGNCETGSEFIGGGIKAQRCKGAKAEWKEDNKVPLQGEPAPSEDSGGQGWVNKRLNNKTDNIKRT